jgi:5-formyltetrahydrofolate cyclo-ligase
MREPATTISANKWKLRAAAIAARDALAEPDRVAAAAAIARRGLPFSVESGAVVAGYSPIRSEIDPGPLMRALAGLGAVLALPIIMSSDRPLSFRAWSSGDPMRRGSLGIPEPLPEAPELIPDIVLVPLAAFDSAGHRIGYGAGHYDRTLAHGRAAKPIRAVGLAFSLQEIEAIPALSHDVSLDYVLTEAKVFDFRSS